MKSIIFLSFLIFLLPSLSARDWTDRDGRIIEARLVEYSGGRVTLERTDGQIFTFSEEVLSDADRAYLNELSGREALAVDRTEVIDLRNPLLGDPLVVEGRVDVASNLLAYGYALARGRDLVVVSDRGLFIQGTTLSGSGVQRPRVYMQRSAELMLEEALENEDARLLNRALGIYRARLSDPYTPVGFLRRGALAARETSPDFALFCEVELANCYREQGDVVSALSILEKHADKETSSEMIGRAQAAYAQLLLEHGYHEQALELARQVRENCPIDGLQYGRSAHDIATSVIALLPTLDKDGTVSTSVREVTLLANVESNPRRYLTLGNDAFQIGNLKSAIDYWRRFQEHFPADESARRVSLRIGECYVQLKDPERALAAFERTWRLYPDEREAWQARIGASEVHRSSGNMADCIRMLEEGYRQVHRREGKARLVAARARHYLEVNQIDDAAEMFIVLLSEYGDQDAASGAWEMLRRHASSRNIRDWRRFTQAVEGWLLKSDGARLGGVSLAPTALSEMRRMALALFLANDRFSQGLSWLRRVGHGSDPMLHEAIIRDEAWYCAEGAQQIANNSRNSRSYAQMSSRQIDDAIEQGLRAWELTDVFVEGFQGLEAAHQLALLDKASNRRQRQVREALEQLLGTRHDRRAREMLSRLYVTMGEARALQQLQ